MKHLYLRILASLFLIFGLSSCNSDSSSEPQQEDSFEVKSVDYINTDKSIQKINDTKELSIESSIQFELNTTKNSNFVLTSDSSCYGASLRGQFYHKQTWKNEATIKVTDLLPLEVYKPLTSSKNQILCNIHIEITNDLGSKTKIDLEDIQIKDLWGYFDMNVMGSKTSVIPHYILAHELKRKIDFPLDYGNIHLLCRDTLNTLKVDASDVDFKLIKEYGFLSKEVNYCRFIFEDLKSKQRQIGKYFYLQKEQAKLSFNLKTNLPNSLLSSNKVIIDLNNKSLAYITIKNVGNVKTYLNLKDIPRSQIEVMAYYSRGKFSDRGYYNSPVVHELYWGVHSGRVVEKDHNSYLEIPPGKAVSLKAYTTGYMSCGKGYTGSVNSLSQCSNLSIFRGYLVNFHWLPDLKFNQKESLNHFKWTSYSTAKTLPPIQSLNKWNYRYWKGTHFEPKFCKNELDLTNTLPKNVTTLMSLDNQWVACQLF